MRGALCAVILSLSLEAALFAQIPGAAPAENGEAPDKAELLMKALSAAYPRLIGQAVRLDNDWAVTLRGEWFYYTDGKLLPERLRPQAANYSPQPFYKYPEKQPAWKKPSPEEAERLAQAAKNRQNGGAANRSIIFFDTLWNIHNRDEAWNQVKTIKFLGKSIMVHHAILEPVALVEQRINAAARRDAVVAAWLKQIHTVSAWNWRNIADVKTRSNHAYGTAIDILPKKPNGETYWLWTAKKKAAWWNVPYSQRVQPTEAVIKIFEDYGFIWGGKWAFYDTMHFEYRPEILLLNGIPIEGSY
ncbi:MAG: M15 family metallopeptidase [Spirochaetaceae bacterium]|nr:M15 family metallopeptidase [Spirochaetaceae bacterium]